MKRKIKRKYIYHFFFCSILFVLFFFFFYLIRKIVWINIIYILSFFALFALSLDIWFLLRISFILALSLPNQVHWFDLKSLQLQKSLMTNLLKVSQSFICINIKNQLIHWIMHMSLTELESSTLFLRSSIFFQIYWYFSKKHKKNESLRFFPMLNSEKLSLQKIT